MTFKSIIRKLEQHKKKMAQTRDGLRELLDEVEDEHDRMSSAIENIEAAIDRLSETV